MVGCVCVVVVVVGGTIQTRHTEIDDVPGPEIPGVAEEPQPELGDLGRELPGHGRHGADLHSVVPTKATGLRRLRCGSSIPGGERERSDRERDFGAPERRGHA